MGNRAVITTAPYSEDNLGIYVHWNGGRESIEGFLEAARRLDYRTPGSDPAYAMARLACAIGLFFGGEASLGIGVNRDLDTDNGDNGTWLIGPGWEVVGQRSGDVSIPLDEAWDTAKATAIAEIIVRRIAAAEAAKETAA